MRQLVQYNNDDIFAYRQLLYRNQTKIDNWAAMGVKGVFVDRFGYDFGVSRANQNQIVDYIHSKNISAFVNAYFDALCKEASCCVAVML